MSRIVSGPLEKPCLCDKHITGTVPSALQDSLIFPLLTPFEVGAIIIPLYRWRN